MGNWTKNEHGCGKFMGHERLELVPRAKGGKVGMRRNSHSPSQLAILGSVSLF